MPFVTYSPYAASPTGTQDGPSGSPGSVCTQTLHATALPSRRPPVASCGFRIRAVGLWGTFRGAYHCVHLVPRGGLLPRGDPAPLSVEGAASGNRLRGGNWTRGREFTLERMISTLGPMVLVSRLYVRSDRLGRPPIFPLEAPCFTGLIDSVGQVLVPFQLCCLCESSGALVTKPHRSFRRPLSRQSWRPTPDVQAQTGQGPPQASLFVCGRPCSPWVLTRLSRACLCLDPLFS